MGNMRIRGKKIHRYPGGRDGKFFGIKDPLGKPVLSGKGGIGFGHAEVSDLVKKPSTLITQADRFILACNALRGAIEDAYGVRVAAKPTPAKFPILAALAKGGKSAKTIPCKSAKRRAAKPVFK